MDPGRGTSQALASSAVRLPDPMTEPESRSLSERVRRGALLSVVNALLVRLAGISVTAVVAHILDPRDFGVYAVALTAYAIVTAIGQAGVASCLVRADLDIDALAPTMVTVSLAGCAALAVAMAAFARPIAAVLGSAYAAGPVRVMALAVLLAGVFAVPGAQLVRDFKQNKLLLANVIGFFPANAALLILARSGSGAMAFAWSRLIGELVVGSVWLISVPKIYRPGLTRQALSVLLRIGVPFAAASFVSYVLLNVDNALVGHFMGAVRLGTYVLAFNVASWPYTLLGAMINSVALPAFSRVMHDAELLRQSVTSAVRDLSLVVMPFCAVMMVVARPLILTLYGAKWAASARVLSVLSVYSAVSMICLLFASILVSKGRTKAFLGIQLIWLCALAPAMALGIRWTGVVGAAYAHIAVIGPIVLPCYVLAMKRATGIRAGSLGRAIFPALLASFAAGLAVKATASQFGNALVQLAMGLSIGGLVYIVAVTPHAIRLLNRGKAIGPRMKRVIRIHNMAAQTVGIPADTPPKHAARGRARCPADRWEEASPGARQRTAGRPGWRRSGPGPAGVEAGAPAETAGSRTTSVRPYGRIVIFALLDDKAAEFDRLAEQISREVGLTEPGTLVYAMHAVPDVPWQRISYEVYRDRAAFSVHERQPHMRRFETGWRSCVLAAEVIELRPQQASLGRIPAMPPAACASRPAVREQPRRQFPPQVAPSGHDERR
jgi:lipopolysaccharide exporter